MVTAHSPIPVALGTASADTEEGRAFLQERLGLAARWIFILSGAFLLLELGMMLQYAPHLLIFAPMLAHFGATLTVGVVWLVTSRTTLSAPVLQWVDGIGLVVTSACFAMMAATLATSHLDWVSSQTEALIFGQMAATSTLFTRTLAVPSTGRRTLWLGAAAFLPHVVGATWVLATADPATIYLPPDVNMTTGQVAFGNWTNLLAWNGVSLAISVVGSRVIFGLRAEADKVRRLGQYTLEEKIGEGGMGVVYRASHAMLRRPTAIKLLPPERTGEEAVQRFEREVQLTARLSHPSTVAIFDYGRTPQGVFY